MKQSLKCFLCFIWLVFISLSSLSLAEEKAPVIFVHGLAVPAAVYEKLVPMKKIFNEYGHDLYIARTPSFATLRQGANVLHSEIMRLVPYGPYHLVGHSMGGLISRMAIKVHQLDDRCLSLTTIATPHRGSKIADWILANIDNPLSEKLLELFGNNIDIVRQLTTNYMIKNFNGSVRNNPNIKYYSMSFYIPYPIWEYTLAPALISAHKIQQSYAIYLNDGLVSINSANWGMSLGVFEGDHYSETAQIPFGGQMIFHQVYREVLENLANNF